MRQIIIHVMALVNGDVASVTGKIVPVTRLILIDDTRYEREGFVPVCVKFVRYWSTRSFNLVCNL